jgi:hypothetical protein
MATLNDLLSDMKDIQDGVGQIVSLVSDLKAQQGTGEIPPEMQQTIDQLHEQATTIESSLKNVTGQSSGTSGGESGGSQGSF